MTSDAEDEGDVEMLVELFDFNSSPETGDNWEETARWIKYEEDVEGLDKHWGRPHVAFLSFHSLMQFRQYFTKGLLLLDPQAAKFSDVTNRLAIGMVSEYGMDSATAEKIANMLQMHRHRKELARESSVTTKKSTAPQQKSSTLSNGDTQMPSITSAFEDADPSKKASTTIATAGEESVEKEARKRGDPARKATAPAPIIEEVETDHAGANGQYSLDGPRQRGPRPSIGSIGRKPSKPLLRRLSTVIGIDALGGGTSGLEDARAIAELKESTHIYTGVIASMTDVRVVMVRFKDSVRFEELGGTLPVRFAFVVVGPQLLDVDYHELGRVVATLMSNATFCAVARHATKRADLLTGVDEFLDLSIIVPPGDIDRKALLTVDDVRKALKQRKRAKAEVDEQKPKNVEALSARKSIATVPRKEFMLETEVTQRPRRVDHVKDALKRTRRPFGGVFDDIKYRAPFYGRDFKDALNFQCITSALFMFCANFASAVAFGEVMGDKTDRYMGVTEILLAHGVCGVIWGLIACQPLCIQAAVGPFLVFEASLYAFCKSQDVDFLAVRFWASVWTVLFMLVITLVEGSCVMRYLTRFTEEIFTGLIAFIFIWEALKFLYKCFNDHPVAAIESYCIDNRTFFNLNTSDYASHDRYLDPLYLNNADSPQILTNQPNTALLSVLLVLLTFVLTYTLKNLRQSVYFGRGIRKMLSDFAVPISVVVVIGIYYLVFSDTYVKHLKAMDDFSLSDPSKRGWLVHPLGTSERRLPMWVVWASAIPALLVGILVFAEVEIIEMLIAKPERCLKRPHGFHWDLLVCSGLALGCSVFGLPWMCPAAVQSLSHVSSLTVMKRTVPGAAPKIDYVVEQRVTCIVVGLLHGAAAFAGHFLRFIPVPVLFGLFFYLGLMGLLGLQFVDRLVLIFMPQKYFPEAPYCKRVSVWRMHLYTLIQIVCFGILLSVNLISVTALAFPFVLTVIAAFRVLVIPRIFQSYELEAIDGKGDEVKSASSEEKEDIIDSEDGVDRKAIL